MMYLDIIIVYLVKLRLLLTERGLSATKMLVFLVRVNGGFLFF